MFAQLILVSIISAALADSSYTPLPLQGSVDNSLQESAPYPSTYQEVSGDGYTIQSGYEGYLVPYEDIEPALALLETKGFVAAGLKFIQTFPKLALRIFFKVIPHVVFVGAFIAVGGLITSLVCHFTSFCSHPYLSAFSNFPFKFDKESVRSFVSDDKLNAATSYVKHAIENYYKTHGIKKSKKLI